MAEQFVKYVIVEAKNNQTAAERYAAISPKDPYTFYSVANELYFGEKHCTNASDITAAINALSASGGAIYEINQTLDGMAMVTFGTCDTAADQQVKAVTLSNSNWQLKTGSIVGVKFTNSNSYSATAAAPCKLNVNSTGDYPIYYGGSAAPTGTNNTAFGTANYIHYYMYDGTYWVWLSRSADADNNTKVTQTATTTNANYEVLFSTTADNTTRTETARKNSNLTFNPSTGNLQVTQINGVTVGSSPKFTDNNDNDKVAQTATTTSANYEVLFSSTADNTTRTEGARKNSNLTFNPSTGNLQVTQINGVTVGDSPKFTDNNTWTAMVGATSSANGSVGYVNATPPKDGYNTKYLRADGTWAVPPDNNTTYSNMSISEFQTGTATSSRTVKAADLKKAVNSYDTAFGTCDTAADQQVKVVTIADSNWQLRVGGIIGVKFTNSNTYSPTASAPVKLNVNNSGEKQIYGGDSATPTGTITTFFGAANYVNYYMYDGTYWVWLSRSADNNTTYTNASLGQGYGTCGTAAATAAKVVTLSSYTLVTGGVVAVKFTYAVPASATLNVNSKGAKAIYYKGAAITAGVIGAGDIGIFMYNGSQYILLGIDTNMTLAKSVTVSATASTGTLGDMSYTHKQDVTWTGMTANDQVQWYITGGSFDEEIAVSSGTNKCTIYFGANPTTLTTLKLVANHLAV